MIGVALKEWAVVCAALAAGRQSVLLRKGGIAEANGEFRPEHERFWLYPTYVHQQDQGVKPDAADLLAQVKAAQPPAGEVRLTHTAEVFAVRYLTEWADVEQLDGLHIWTAATIRQRFDYRRPGLFAFELRVTLAASSRVLGERPEYAGCKSWVPLMSE